MEPGGETKIHVTKILLEREITLVRVGDLKQILPVLPDHSCEGSPQCGHFQSRGDDGSLDICTVTALYRLPPRPLLQRGEWRGDNLQ